MSKSNMINPANYYNPFAKYNYVSKTRGVYFPKTEQPVISANQVVEKSTSIYSENYDAEADIMQAMNAETSGTSILGLISDLFRKN